MPDKIEVIHPVNLDRFARFQKHNAGTFEATDINGIPGPSSTSPVYRKIRAAKRRILNKDVKNETADVENFHLVPGHVLGRRSVQMQMSHYEIRHDEPVNVDVIDPDTSYALPASIIGIGGIHILLGIISLTISVVQYYTDAAFEEVFQGLFSHIQYPAFFIFVSEVLTIIAGIGIVACTLYNITYIFRRVYPTFLWLILMLDLIAIVYSVASWRHVNTSEFGRIFESQVEIFCKNDFTYHNILWNHPLDSKDPWPRAWDKIELKLRCCGFRNLKDWPSLCNGKIPLSCCRRHFLNECHEKLKARNQRIDDDRSKGILEANVSDITQIRHFLHQKSCSNVLVLEASSIRRDWIIFPLIIAIFDTILMIGGNHKAREITFQLQTTEGRRGFEEFRQVCWDKFKCKNKNTVSPSMDSVVSKSKPILADQGPILPTVGFITNEESLRGMIKFGDETVNMSESDINISDPSITKKHE